MTLFPNQVSLLGGGSSDFNTTFGGHLSTHNIPHIHICLFILTENKLTATKGEEKGVTDEKYIIKRDKLLSCSVMANSFATPGTVVCQAPLCIEFSGQENWNGLPFPSPENLPSPGIEPVAPASQSDSLPLSHLGSLREINCFT